jgi:hypothetical protein
MTLFCECRKLRPVIRKIYRNPHTDVPTSLRTIEWESEFCLDNSTIGSVMVHPGRDTMENVQRCDKFLCVDDVNEVRCCLQRDDGWNFNKCDLWSSFKNDRMTGRTQWNCSKR